jgi:uncharacterized damage-inducible protein DinB
MTPDQATVIAGFLIPQIEQEVQTTARVLAAVPDDKKDYTPHGTCMKAGDMAEHIAGADLWFLEGVVAGAFGAYPEPTGLPTAELAARYTAKASEILEKIKGLSGEDLAKPVQFYHMTLPNVAYLQFMQKHSVHHRGQLSAYLRPMGAKVPSIYGGSADEPFQAAAAGDGK